MSQTGRSIGGGRLLLGILIGLAGASLMLLIADVAGVVEFRFVRSSDEPETVPPLAWPSEKALLSSLTSDLQTVRGQLELCRVQHLDKYPAMDRFVEQMTGTTDINGDPVGTDLGPYLHRIPTNPYTGRDDIGRGPIGTSSWYYDERTGEFRANDSEVHAKY
jgi:hypothetical protein